MQFSTPQPCAPGLNIEICSCLHQLFQHDCRHSFRFLLCIDRFFHDSCGNSEFNLGSKFCLHFNFCFSLHCNQRDDIKCVGCLFTWYAVYNFHMARMIFAQVQMNHYVSQFGHGNPQRTNAYQHRYINGFSMWYIVNINNFAFNSSGNAGAITISLYESDFCVVISSECYTHGSMLTASVGFDFIISDKWIAVSCGNHSLPYCEFGFPHGSLIWLLLG